MKPAQKIDIWYLVSGKVKNTVYKIVNTKYRPGFTLIELLVVISVIGILAAFSIAAFTTVQAKGRDAKRKNDLDAIQTALEMYKNDFGRYPTENGCDSSRGSVNDNCSATTEDDWSPTSGIHELETQGFIKDLPVDPKNNLSHYYYYEPDGPGQGVCIVTWCAYVLGVNLESPEQMYRIYSP